MQKPVIVTRPANLDDIEAIRRIYNQGIEDRIATLDGEPKTKDELAAWWEEHGGRHAVLIATIETAEVVGWASLNRYSHRCAHSRIADLSVYVDRNFRGRGIGARLLHDLERLAVKHGFHKIVLFALERNAHGKALYEKMGFRVVGVFKEHGILDGKLIDVVAMEKLVRPPGMRRRWRPAHR